MKDPCMDEAYTTIHDTAQEDSELEDGYTGVDMVFNYASFTTTPAYCQPLLQVYCSAITIPSTAFAQVTCPTLSEDNKLTWNYNVGSYLAFGYAPGDYIYTYNVCIFGYTQNCSSFTVTVTLIDPCDPPLSLSQLDLTDQEYTITQAEVQYQHASYSILPLYCPVEYSYVTPRFVNGEQAINFGSNRVVTIYYANSLLPMIPAFNP